MTPEHEQFFNDCPAWARELGIRDDYQWCLANKVSSFDWSRRHDCLDEAKAKGDISSEDKNLIVRVLMVWDGM